MKLKIKKSMSEKILDMIATHKRNSLHKIESVRLTKREFEQLRFEIFGTNEFTPYLKMGNIYGYPIEIIEGEGDENN